MTAYWRERRQRSQQMRTPRLWVFSFVCYVNVNCEVVVNHISMRVFRKIMQYVNFGFYVSLTTALLKWIHTPYLLRIFILRHARIPARCKRIFFLRCIYAKHVVSHYGNGNGNVRLWFADTFRRSHPNLHYLWYSQMGSCVSSYFVHEGSGTNTAIKNNWKKWHFW